jgi:hypothetical protein
LLPTTLPGLFEDIKMKLSKIVLAFAMIAASASSFATDMATVDFALTPAAAGDVAAIASDSLLAGGYGVGAGTYVSNQAAIEQAATSIGGVAVIDQTMADAGALVGNVAYIVQTAVTPGAVAYINQGGSLGFAMIKQ